MPQSPDPYVSQLTQYLCDGILIYEEMVHWCLNHIFCVSMYINEYLFDWVAGL